MRCKENTVKEQMRRVRLMVSDEVEEKKSMEALREALRKWDMRKSWSKNGN